MSYIYESFGTASELVLGDHFVEGILPQGKLRVSVYRADIFRVQVTRDAEFRDHSYAVIQAPEYCPLELKMKRNPLP